MLEYIQMNKNNKRNSVISFITQRKTLVFLLIVMLSVLPVSAGVVPSAYGKADNLAPHASDIYASSEYSAQYNAYNVVDGIVWDEEMRLPNWVSHNQREADVSLKWEEAVTITRIVAYGCLDRAFRVISGSITAGDTVLELNSFKTTGAGQVIDLEVPVTVTEINIHLIGAAVTAAVGLSEIEVYDENGNNVALEASAEASSEYPDGTPDWYYSALYEGWYAADNLINGWAEVNLPQGMIENEWASLGESLPEITLEWDEPISIGTVVLVDRVGSSDFIYTGEIIFENGETIPFDGIDNNGDPLYIDVPDVTTSSLTVSVTDSTGPNIGLAEIEVYTEHFDEDKNVIVKQEQTDTDDSDLNEHQLETEETESDYGAAPPDISSPSIVILAIFALFTVMSLFSLIKTKKKGNII